VVLASLALAKSSRQKVKNTKTWRVWSHKEVDEVYESNMGFVRHFNGEGCFVMRESAYMINKLNEHLSPFFSI